MRFRVNTNIITIKIIAIIILITPYLTEELHRMTLKPTISTICEENNLKNYKLFKVF
jgi:hypothetical protein